MIGLAAAPQRIDPKKPGPPAFRTHDWQLHHQVLFDGTARAPLGRQLFVPEETRKAPPLVPFAKVNGARRPMRQAEGLDVQARVRRLLDAQPCTIADLVSEIRGHGEDVVRNAVSRLQRDGVVEIVGSRPNPNAGERGQRPFVFLYGVRT